MMPAFHSHYGAFLFAHEPTDRALKGWMPSIAVEVAGTRGRRRSQVLIDNSNFEITLVTAQQWDTEFMAGRVL